MIWFLYVATLIALPQSEVVRKYRDLDVMRCELTECLEGRKNFSLLLQKFWSGPEDKESIFADVMQKRPIFAKRWKILLDPMFYQVEKIEDCNFEKQEWWDRWDPNDLNGITDDDHKEVSMLALMVLAVYCRKSKQDWLVRGFDFEHSSAAEDLALQKHRQVWHDALKNNKAARDRYEYITNSPNYSPKKWRSMVLDVSGKFFTHWKEVANGWGSTAGIVCSAREDAPVVEFKSRKLSEMIEKTMPFMYVSILFTFIVSGCYLYYVYRTKLKSIAEAETSGIQDGVILT